MQNRLQYVILLIVSLIVCNVRPLFAQTKANIFDDATDITWLGLDFSQVVYIGSAAQFAQAGEITDQQFRDKYVPAWNNIFIAEQKKYNVAEAMRRNRVTYAIEVTEKANRVATTKVFSNNPDNFNTLTEQKVRELVNAYDFQGKVGIGMLFFVGGMSKDLGMARVWVTFVDMRKHTVLFTSYESGKPGGFGFRNYWAKAFYNILLHVEENYKNWKKPN